MERTVAFILILAMLASITSCALPFFGSDNGTPTPPDSEKGEENGSSPDIDEDSDDKLWNSGYIGSGLNREYKNIINKSDVNYSYTDVIVLDKKGTKVTFTDIYQLEGEDSYYTLSFWIREGDSWVIDTTAPNLTCGYDSAVRNREPNRTEYTYISTYDNECIRFCYFTGNPMLLNGNYPDMEITETEEEGTLADTMEVYEWARSDRERAYYDVLEGKSINFIGDSLFAGHSLGKHYTWPALIGAKYSMPYSNNGISGCTLSACAGGENPIINRYDKMPDNSPDIVVFEGGRNDFNKGASLGAAYGGDLTTYRGAVSALIDGLREKYPNAIIIAVTFWKANDKQNSIGLTCDEYSSAMMEVCRAKGVPYIDATNQAESGIYMTDKSFREQYSLASSDVCHLNYEGMKLALRFFEKEIARIVSEQ